MRFGRCDARSPTCRTVGGRRGLAGDCLRHRCFVSASDEGDRSEGLHAEDTGGAVFEPDGGHIHGLNERIRVTSVYEGRTFLYRLVKIYAQQ